MRSRDYYIICIVRKTSLTNSSTESTNSSKMYADLTETTDLLYHRIDLLKPTRMCRNFKQVATLGMTFFYFLIDFFIKGLVRALKISPGLKGLYLMV